MTVYYVITGVALVPAARSLDEARRRNLALRRKVLRRTWLPMLAGMSALVGVLVAVGLWNDGDARAGDVMVVSSVVAVVSASSAVLPIRAERARKAAVRDYTTAYERVVAAAMSAQHSRS